MTVKDKYSMLSIVKSASGGLYCSPSIEHRTSKIVNRNALWQLNNSITTIDPNLFQYNMEHCHSKRQSNIFYAVWFTEKNQINRKKVWTVWTVWTAECRCPLFAANYHDTRPHGAARTDRQYSNPVHTWISKVWTEYGQYGQKYGRQECIV